MKALSIQQGWLFAITDLDKRIENRTWKPPAYIIGQRIALHASKKADPGASSAIFHISGQHVPLSVPLGMIVATAVVVGWVDERGNASSKDLLGMNKDKWFFGPIGWVFGDVRKVDRLIQCKGALNLWEAPEF